MKPAIDLTRHHWRHRHGDIDAYGTWFLGADSGPRPCLVLIHAHNYARTTPCAVRLEDAWRWSEEIGDPADAARYALAFAEALGLGATPSAAIRVRGIIVDHLGDLINMPPMPNAMREATVIGEAKVTSREGGEVVKHHELVDRL